MLTSLKYLLFAVICTRNCEYHSWVYFLKFPKPQNAIHISTQENLTVLSISLHVLPQASKDNHAKCQTSNFMFSCTSSNLCPLESIQVGKMPSLRNLPTQICLSFGGMQFAATSQFESDQKYFLPSDTFWGKIRARMKRTNYI